MKQVEGEVTNRRRAAVQSTMKVERRRVRHGDGMVRVDECVWEVWDGLGSSRDDECRVIGAFMHRVCHKMNQFQAIVMSYFIGESGARSIGVN